MKKILLTIVAVMAAMNMSAQIYVGGSIGFGSVKAGAGDSEATYKFIPEVGYNFNDEWAVGAALGYQKGACSIGKGNFTQNVTSEIFSIDAYARYSPWDFDLVKVFFDGGFGYGSVKDAGSLFNIGVKPGVAVSLTDEISFVAHLGFFGFENFSPDGGGKSSTAFGLDLSNSVSFGVYYNF